MARKNLDNKIISKLLEDGRKSFREISKELDVSVTTVSNHVKKMQENGIIKGFKPNLNYPKLGYKITSISMIKAEGEKILEVAEYLKDIKNFTDVYEVTGDFDLIAIGKFKNTEDMNETIKELLSHENIIETNTNVTLSTIKEGEEIKPE